MGTALAFFLFYEGSNLFFAYKSKGKSNTKTIYLDQNLGAMHCVSE